MSTYPPWAPKEVVAWLDRLIAEGKYESWGLEFHERLITDPRMEDVWAWYARTLGDKDSKETVPRYNSPRYYDRPTLFCSAIRKATQMPGKPGNMPPQQRKEYFEKVRKHANALRDLLEDTKFDHPFDNGHVLKHDSWGKAVVQFVESARDFALSLDGADSTTSFLTTTDGEVYSLPMDYPECTLTLQLAWLTNWTREDDYWDRGFSARSSKPIRQAGENGRLNYFSCTLYEALARHKVTMPYPLLATIANVALELPADEQATEDTVRKQVTRYLQRLPDKKVEEFIF